MSAHAPRVEAGIVKRLAARGLVRRTWTAAEVRDGGEELHRLAHRGGTVLDVGGLSYSPCGDSTARFWMIWPAGAFIVDGVTYWQHNGGSVGVARLMIDLIDDLDCTNTRMDWREPTPEDELDEWVHTGYMRGIL